MNEFLANVFIKIKTCLFNFNSSENIVYFFTTFEINMSQGQILGKL